MGLIPCPTCRRHVRLEENACPFCGNAAPIGGFAAIAAAAALALAGCGGKSKTETPPENKGDPAEVTPDAGVDEPPPDDPDRGGDIQPEYGVDIY
jgi:predicted small lipoprotein YifL